MKKCLVLLLACILLYSCALAEVKVNVEGLPICSEPITITVSGLSANGVGNAWNDTVMVDVIEKQYGIKMDCNEFSGDAWSTQFTMMMAADTMPDMILNATLPIADAQKYAKEGYFLNLMDYIDVMPNLQAMFEKYPVYQTYASLDGGIYYLPTLNINEWNNYGRAWINNAWLKNLGLEYPTTLDEFYQVLVAFRDQDANGNGDVTDEIPLTIMETHDSISGFSGDFVQDYIKTAFGIYTRNCYYSLQADKEGKVSLIETSDDYKEYVTFMRKLYAEGLLDKEAFIQTREEKDAKVADNRLGFFSAAAPFAAAGAEITFDLDYDWFGMLTSERSPQRTLVATSYIGDVKILVNSNTKYPDAICRLIDSMLSHEGSIIAGNGWPGITFDWVDQDVGDGISIRTQQVYIPEGYESQEDYRAHKATINMGFLVNGSYGSIMKDFLVNKATVEQLEKQIPTRGWQNLMTIRILRNNEDIQYLDNFPILLYTEKELQQLTTIKTDISLYTQSMFTQFVTGQTDMDAGWNTYIKTLQSMNLERAIDIEQAAYDRFISK